MYVIGIDPGLDGGISLVTPDYNFIVIDPPILDVVGAKKKNRNGESKESHKRLYNVSEIVKVLQRWKDLYVPIVSYVENVHAMPGQGVTSMFSMGRGFGMYEGVITALGIRLEYVAPQTWKKAMLAGQGKDKDAAIYKAQQLFPNAELRTQRGRLLDGRAEALLIAEYGRKQHLVRNPLF